MNGLLTGMQDPFKENQIFPSPAKIRKQATQEAIGSILGTVLAGGLARALGASDEFAAGLARGGLLVGQQGMQEAERQAQAIDNLRNRLATELVILGIKNAAQREKEVEAKRKLQLFAEKLSELYQKHHKNGVFDFESFMHEASLLGPQLGIDPAKSKPILDAFMNAQKIANRYVQAKPIIKVVNGVVFYKDPTTGKVEWYKPPQEMVKAQGSGADIETQQRQVRQAKQIYSMFEKEAINELINDPYFADDIDVRGGRILFSDPEKAREFWNAVEAKTWEKIGQSPLFLQAFGLPGQGFNTQPLPKVPRGGLLQGLTISMPQGGQPVERWEYDPRTGQFRRVQ